MIGNHIISFLYHYKNSNSLAL